MTGPSTHVITISSTSFLPDCFFKVPCYHRNNLWTCLLNLVHVYVFLKQVKLIKYIFSLNHLVLTEMLKKKHLTSYMIPTHLSFLKWKLKKIPVPVHVTGNCIILDWVQVFKMTKKRLIEENIFLNLGECLNKNWQTKLKKNILTQV